MKIINRTLEALDKVMGELQGMLDSGQQNSTEYNEKMAERHRLIMEERDILLSNYEEKFPGQTMIIWDRAFDLFHFRDQLQAVGGVHVWMQDEDINIVTSKLMEQIEAMLPIEGSFLMAGDGNITFDKMISIYQAIGFMMKNIKYDSNVLFHLVELLNGWYEDETRKGRQPEPLIRGHIILHEGGEAEFRNFHDAYERLAFTRIRCCPDQRRYIKRMIVGMPAHKFTRPIQMNAWHYMKLAGELIEAVKGGGAT